MRILDRYLFVTFLRTYAQVFLTLVGLYVVIDLFSNFDEFIKDRVDAANLAARVGKYYFMHSFEYFWRLSPVITQVAAMSTLAALHKQNEIVPMLAAGIPTKRALVPILGGVAVVVALGIANRELFLPAHSEFLQRAHEDVEGKRELVGSAQYDAAAQLLVRARFVRREEQALGEVSITLPDLAEIAVPAVKFTTHPDTGRAGFRFPLPAGRDPNAPVPASVVALPGGDWFVPTALSIADFARRSSWMHFASTRDLLRELRSDQLTNPEEVRAVIHARMTQPATLLVLTLLGVPFVMQWDRRTVYLSLVASLALSAGFFVLETVSQ